MSSAPLTVYNIVAANIIDANDEVMALVYGYIKRAVHDLEDLRLFRVNREVLTVVTVEDQRKLDDLPSDWNGIRKNPFYVDGTGAKGRMTWLPDTEELDKSYSEDPADKGPPAEVLVTEDELEVYPLPDGLAATGSVYSDGDYRVHVPYWKYLPDLTPAQTNYFFNSDSLTLRYIEEKTTAEALLFNRDREEWMTWGMKAQGTLKKIKMEMKYQALPRDINLAPRRSVRASRNQRRL